MTSTPVDDCHVALLRGINVGGRNKVAMDSLKAAFVAEGCDDVRTYIQSGNVVFRAAGGLASRIPSLVSERLTEDVGLRIPLVTRSAADLRLVATNNPFLEAGRDPKSLAVGFLQETPSPEAIAKLDPDRSPPDEFAVRGGEIYLYIPNGAARSKLSNAYFDSKLETTTTFRNWRTVLKLVEMSTAPG